MEIAQVPRRAHALGQHRQVALREELVPADDDPARTADWNQTYTAPMRHAPRRPRPCRLIAGVHSLSDAVRRHIRKPQSSQAHRPQRRAAAQNESHFDQVVGPPSGSYYVENLTQSIAAGRGSSSSKSRRRAATPRLTRPASSRSASPHRPPPRTKPLRRAAGRCSAPINIPTSREVAIQGDHRRAVDAQTGRGQHTGTLPRRHGLRRDAFASIARASGPRRSCSPAEAWQWPAPRQFSCNFFGCAGIRVQDNTFFKSIEGGCEAALESTEIVVVCAADDDYAEAAPKVKGAARRQGDPRGRQAPAYMPELQAQGITNFINVKSNVLETLKFYLKEMGNLSTECFYGHERYPIGELSEVS